MTAAVIAFAIAAGGWYYTHRMLRESQQQLVRSTLEPAATLLQEQQALIGQLQSPPFAESGKGILQSYLVKLRRDGLARTAAMKQLLDQLAQDDTVLLTLIAAYAPSASTPEFAAASGKFRNYAIAWQDRWNSAMELYMAGGDYPTADVPLPTGLPAAMRGEMAAAQALASTPLAKPR
jgi:hypothetical protein